MSNESMVKKVRCINKHYYDANIYNECPHCGEARRLEEKPILPKNIEKSGVKSGTIFTRRKKKETATDESAIEEKISNNLPIPDGSDRSTNREAIPSSERISVLPEYAKEQKAEKVPDTVPMPHNDDGKNSSGKNDAGVIEYIPDDDGNAYLDDHIEEDKNSEALENLPEQGLAKGETKSDQADESDLRRIVKGSSVTYNGEKTMGVFFGGDKKKRDPVAGWLVCIKGADFGASYEIYAKNNTIGRSTDNDVVLKNEPKVSRESHAVIFYDYKKYDFYIKPDRGSNPYINDEIVLNTIKLKKYDKLEIGGCLLLFVPLCGEDFSWEKYIDENKG